MSAHKNTPGWPEARIEIYFKTWCPYSRKALALLSNKGVPFAGIDVTSDRVREAEMIDRSGRTSVPKSLSMGRRSVVPTSFPLSLTPGLSTSALALLRTPFAPLDSEFEKTPLTFCNKKEITWLTLFPTPSKRRLNAPDPGSAPPSKSWALSPT